MKRSVLFLTALGLFIHTQAQEQRAAESKPEQGMLVPMMTDEQMRALPAKGQGELVFNKTERGFYYFDGTDWVPLLMAQPTTDGTGIQWNAQRVGTGTGVGVEKLTTGTSGFWDLTGNAATDPAVNFIGTTDAQPVKFKAGGFHAGQISAVGGQQTAIGFRAGEANTGGANSFFGGSAGLANTTGSENTMIGTAAGIVNTTGFFNTFVGAGAGDSNVGAIGNTLVGARTGNDITSGGGNTMIGQGAGTLCTTGVSNTYVGASARGDNTSDGVVVGSQAKSNGNANVVLGVVSGGGVTGSGNVYIGQNSAASGSFTGSGVTLVGEVTNIVANGLTNASAIGQRAAVSSSNSLVLGSINGVNGATVNTNVGIGTTAPVDRLHVVGNIRIVDGNQAAGKVLTSNVNGTGTWQALPTATIDWARTGNAGTNPATDFIGTIDAQALRFRTNNLWAGQLPSGGSGVVGYGLGAGQVNTGVDNTFIGNSAGGQNTTGFNNTFVGRVAGALNTTSTNNTFIGTAAGQNSNGGGNATMIGAFAGVGTTTGTNNTFLGQAAGSANTTGASNTFVGTTAGNTNITGSKNTVIGESADVASGALSNATAIGSNAQVDASNSLVLGGISGVNGGVSVNVGIGTTAPADRLHVVGNIRMVDGTQGAGKVLTSDANGTGTWQTPAAATADWGRNGNSGTDPATDFVGTADAQAFRVRTNNTNRISVTSNGAVGVGNTDPLVNLDVTGGLAMRSGTLVQVGPGTTTVNVGDRSFVRLVVGSNSNAVLSDGLQIGQLLHLLNVGSFNFNATIADSPATTNCNLVATRVLGPKDTLTLVWDGTDWIELAFANN